MSDSEYESVSPFSIEDDEIPCYDSDANTGFIVLRHPLLDTRSLPSTLTGFTGRSGSDGNLSSTLDRLSLCNSSIDSLYISAEPDSSSVSSEIRAHPANPKRGKTSMIEAKPRIQSSRDTSTSTECRSGTSNPIVSYEDASAFISCFISSPEKGNGAELNLLCALIIELGLRTPTASDLPYTLTSARKILKAEAHVNVKEYIATRHQGQPALREILKPSKNALRKEIRKGNKAPLQWVKQHGLQVLLVSCFP